MAGTSDERRREHAQLGLRPAAEVLVGEVSNGNPNVVEPGVEYRLPQIEGWTGGPRLTFNLGFADLGPGRYSEAWVPANLIPDQCYITFELNLINTGICPQRPLQSTACSARTTGACNGPRTALRGPHCSKSGRPTPLQLTDVVALPVSGTSV